MRERGRSSLTPGREDACHPSVRKLCPQVFLPARAGAEPSATWTGVVAMDAGVIARALGPGRRNAPGALPSRPLTRARLVQLLDATTSASLTSVVAPRGTGKRTAVRGWLDVSAGPWSWAVLRPADDEPRALARRAARRDQLRDHGRAIGPRDRCHRERALRPPRRTRSTRSRRGSSRRGTNTAL